MKEKLRVIGAMEKAKAKVLQSPENKKRAKAALAAGAWMTGEEEKYARENLINLLTNIRHACDSHGLNFGDLDTVAYTNYRLDNLK